MKWLLALGAGLVGYRYFTGHFPWESAPAGGTTPVDDQGNPITPNQGDFGFGGGGGGFVGGGGSPTGTTGTDQTGGSQAPGPILLGAQRQIYHHLAPAPAPGGPNAFGYTYAQYTQAARAWCVRAGIDAAAAHWGDCLFSFGLQYGDFAHYNGKRGGGNITVAGAPKPPAVAKPPTALHLNTAQIGPSRHLSGIGRI